MFHMVQKRQSVGSIIKLEEDEDDAELAAFLDKFDLDKKCVIIINYHFLLSSLIILQSGHWKHR
jgi:hypothetical protein